MMSELPIGLLKNGDGHLTDVVFHALSADRSEPVPFLNGLLFPPWPLAAPLVLTKAAGRVFWPSHGTSGCCLTWFLPVGN